MDNRAKSYDRDEFDVLTLHPGKSPSKNFRNRELQKSKTHKTLDQEALIPEGYEDHLMREELLKKRNDDPFKLLGVSGDDKMTFFLLKWVFNAIKLESDIQDEKMQG